MLRFALNPDTNPSIDGCFGKNNRRQPFKTIVAPTIANSRKIDVCQITDERLNSLVTMFKMCVDRLLKFPELVSGEPGVRRP